MMMKQIIKIDNVGRFYVPAGIRDLMPCYKPGGRCELILNPDGSLTIRGKSVTRADKFKEKHPGATPQAIKPCYIKQPFRCPEHRNCDKCREEYWNGSD